MKLWKPKMSFGWFKGNPFYGFKLVLFEPVENYPSGWLCIIIFTIAIGKFEFSLYLDNPRA